MVWLFRYSEMNKHLWAFWYYCRRLGDRCWLDKRHDIVGIERQEYS